MKRFPAWDTSIEDGWRCLRIWDHSSGVFAPNPGWRLWPAKPLDYDAETQSALNTLIDLIHEDHILERIEWTQEFITLRVACAKELSK